MKVPAIEGAEDEVAARGGADAASASPLSAAPRGGSRSSRLGKAKTSRRCRTGRYSKIADLGGGAALSGEGRERIRGLARGDPRPRAFDRRGLDADPRRLAARVAIAPALSGSGAEHPVELRQRLLDQSEPERAVRQLDGARRGSSCSASLAVCCTAPALRSRPARA